MNLHYDKLAFQVLLEQIHERTGYRVDVLEKDYYVVLVLKELAEKQKKGLKAYFKGGTALYKALKTTNRFSEDIDISVDTRGCTRTQNDKRLEQATKKYNSLERDVSNGRTNRSEIISVYSYHPVALYDENDVLQRFGKLKVEATSFTISEPVKDLEVTPMIYDFATQNERDVLMKKYDVAPFNIKTITLERIFIDKLFAAEAYTRRSYEPSKAFEAAKHIYDLSVLIQQPDIQALIADEKQIQRLLDIRVEEEINRLDGISGIMPYEFSFFNECQNDRAIRHAYAIMQTQYVFRPEDRIEYDEAIESLHVIDTRLKENRAWMMYRIKEENNHEITFEEIEQDDFFDSWNDDEMER
ncbi:MAG: nucleotidyl transferase AbiEii/AbiGii toxin family protein [Clostridia bacterium]|nr:nucleotidyl transferase AbiEii/AbiGii toxin family protein [Clostridia bacterium]